MLRPLIGLVGNSVAEFLNVPPSNFDITWLAADVQTRLFALFLKLTLTIGDSLMLLSVTSLGGDVSKQRRDGLEEA